MMHDLPRGANELLPHATAMSHVENTPTDLTLRPVPGVEQPQPLDEMLPILSAEQAAASEPIDPGVHGLTSSAAEYKPQSISETTDVVSPARDERLSILEVQDTSMPPVNEEGTTIPSEVFVPDDYYELFRVASGGSDLELMRGCLSSMKLPDDLLESLRAVPEAKLLVLGSATHRNIDNMASIDRVLRPGQGSNDAVLMIDYNHYPMAQHQQQWDWLKGPVRDREEYADLQYPDFAFGQADMRRLPVGSGTLDAVVSDYTLNFLNSFGDVEETFSEVGRVLKPGGVMLLAVEGHKAVDPKIPVSDLDVKTPQYVERSGLVTSQFPLQMYVEAAAQHGLEMRASYGFGSGLLCGVLQKR